MTPNQRPKTYSECGLALWLQLIKKYWNMGFKSWMMNMTHSWGLLQGPGHLHPVRTVRDLERKCLQMINPVSMLSVATHMTIIVARCWPPEAPLYCDSSPSLGSRLRRSLLTHVGRDRKDVSCWPDYLSTSIPRHRTRYEVSKCRPHPVHLPL